MRKLRNLAKRGDFWYFTMTVKGRRESVSLKTMDVEVAKARAKELREKAWREEWEVIAGHKQRSYSSVGEIIAEYRRICAGHVDEGTRENNINALELVVRRGLGREEMSDEEVAEESAAVLNGKLVQGFCGWHLAKANGDRAREASAKRTVGSYLRQARSVFQRKGRFEVLYKRAGLKLPELREFLEETVAEAPDLQRRPPSEEELRPLFEAAPAWRQADPGAWMAWRLAVWTGLRRGALAALRWEWLKQLNGHWVFDVPEGELKNGKAATVPVHPVLAAELQVFQAWRVNQGWPWHPNRPEVAVEWYGLPAGDAGFVLPGIHGLQERCAVLFDRVYAWMKSLGWTERVKLQGMRRYFLKLADEQHGTEWAQALAGHSEASTLTKHYIGRKEMTGRVVELPSAGKE